MQNADASLPAFSTHSQELLTRALKPCGRHAAADMPDGAELFPVSGVAPDSPVVDYFPNCEFFKNIIAHGGSFLDSQSDCQRLAKSALTVFLNTPIPSISHTTTSPGSRNFPSPKPPPAHVPLAITSPGCSVMP